VIKENIYVGIDPSLTGTGVCVISDNKILHEKLIETAPEIKEKGKNPKKVSIEERLIFIINEIYNLIAPYKNIRSIYVEGLSFGSKSQGATDLAALHLYIRTNLFEKGIKCEVVPPLELKKWSTGIATAPKNVVLKEVYKRWGISWKADFFDDNICDAFCLSMFARNLYLNPEQKEVRDLKMKKTSEAKKKAKQNKRNKSKSIKSK